MKTIIFDIDGTAIDSPEQKLPTQRLIDAVRKTEESHHLCAATGRVWTFAEPVLKGLCLTAPCIIAAGTQICDPQTGKILWQCNIDPADLRAAVEVIQQYPDYKVLYNDCTEDDYLHGGIAPKDLDISETTYFLEQIFVPSAVAPEIVAKLSTIEGIACTLVVAQRPGFNDIHVTNRNATKEHAVAELLKMLGVDKRDTTGIGDGNNDIHLFRAVHKKVAMGNAVPELKVAADLVIGSVKEDGLAEFLDGLAEKIFAYGTLQDPVVQKNVFGRTATTHPDTLDGFKKGNIEINNKQYFIAIANSDSRMDGCTIDVTPEELSLIDDYETAAYKRVQVKLVSGRSAWVYCKP